MRLALAEDSGIFREALARSLTELGWQVAVSVGSAVELLAALPGAGVDLVVMDVAMPPTRTDEGVVAARRVRVEHPGVGVLLLSAHAATPQAVELLREFGSGLGYLRKDEVADIGQLRDCLERVRAGELVIDRSLVRRLLAAPVREDALTGLSAQEREVLRLMAEGHTNAGIGRLLHLAPRTVEDHVGRVFDKLGIRPHGGGPENRRVLAVLTWLRLTGRTVPPAR